MELNSLIDQYSSGNVIPIIGCELFRVNITPEESYNIHEYIIKKSFYPGKDWDKPPALLSELPLAVPDFNQNSLIGLLKKIQDKQKDISLLTNLSMLKHFQTFLIASFYKEFEKEVKRINADETFEVFKNDINSNHSLSNINFENEKRKIVYLFDNIDNPFFAFNDEELLESIHSLSRTVSITTGNTLLSHLTGKTLLFIGCDFSDWFMRYCIRVLTNMPYGKPQRAFIISDHPAKLSYQDFFFKKHNIQVLHSTPVKDFVNEFCSLANEVQDFINLFRDSRVFISYSHVDFGAAKDLNSRLRQAGIDPWFDQNDKQAAKHVDTIRENVKNPKTKLMIAIISKELMEKVQNEKNNYVRDVEWDMASFRIKAAKYYNPDDKFCIVPYFIDDPRNYLDKLPEYISDQFRFGTNAGGFDEIISKIQILLK